MRNDCPQVSIGLPVFNGEGFLATTLDSILAQTYTEFELTISDNASTDATQEICRAYATRDPRIRYHRNAQNVGAAGNYNRVFEMSCGEYFKWASHDDLLAPTYLERCTQVLDEDPGMILCYPSTTPIDEHGKPLDIDPADRLDLCAPRPHQRFAEYIRAVRSNLMCNAIVGVIRANILRMTPLIGAYASSDKILLAELALRGRFHQLPDLLFFRRYHAASSIGAHPGLAERNEWFDPAAKGLRRAQAWTWFSEYLGAIRRVPMSTYEKVHCTLTLGGWLYWSRRRLAKELALRMLFWR